MKGYEKAIWHIVFILLFVTSAWNLYENRQLKKRITTKPDEEYLSLLDIKFFELSQSGKFLKWPNNMKSLGPVEDVVGYGLVLAINEASCDICRDEQTQFVLNLGREMNEPVFRIVVSAKYERYVRSYMRLNGLAGFVFYDHSYSFFEKNDINKSPVLLFHNPQGEILAAHYPIPNRPEMSKPFHKMVRSFMGL